MNAPQRIALLFLCLTASLSAQNTVGGGAPSPAVANAFIAAFYQGGFNNIVVDTPDNNVSKLGPTGYYQQFSLLGQTSTKLGLVIPSIAATALEGSVVQVINPLYSYYLTIGATLAGYPTSGTINCPNVPNCQVQVFSNNYALFYYSSGNINGNGFQTSGNIFTAWNNSGGPSAPVGMAYAAQAAVVSPLKTTGNAQLFSAGQIVSVTSGANSGNTFIVAPPYAALYSQAGGPTGSLGFPTSNDITLPDGTHKQTFETGRIVYNPAVPGSATILLAVNEIDITPSGTLTLQFGQSATVSVNVFDTYGAAAPGRAISWVTSNSSAVAITPNGYSAVLKGVGNGIANITAISEGFVSKALVVTAIEPCCQVGQGAPTSTIQAAFQAAVTRNKLAVLVPAATPVRRSATGYLQDLYSPDGKIHYLVAKSDLNQLAFVITGPTLDVYTASGGSTGSLAYPSSDLSSGGTQLFEGGALSGLPVQIVTGGVLKKWALANYETGALGAPAAPQASFSSISGYGGYSQAFSGGAIFAISNGTLSGQAFQSSGLILARYLALSGPAGVLGIPVADATTNAGIVRQNFENGYIDLQPGASAAVEHLNPRVPTITVTPSTVLPGSRIHLAITGFNNNASLRVSQTGQADFLVPVPAGSYQWDAYIASSAAAGAVTVKAVDAANAANTATGTYTIRSIAAARPQLVKSQGDNQTSSPGSVLPSPLVITLIDSSGSPISGATVTFLPSPGATALPASAVTDANGRVSTSLRLPVTPGLTALTAQALGQIAIFNAQSSGSVALPNFPVFVSPTGTGAQVTAAASILRYYQNLNRMPAANGQSTPSTLDSYLTTLPDGYLNSSQLVNFWRLVNFTGGNVDVSVENTDLTTVRTLTATGDPVLLSLALTQDGVPSAGTTVVSTGIAADGSVTILDPNPYFAQPNLNSYIYGFSVNGHNFQATIVSAVRLLPRTPSPTGFIVDAISQPYATFPALTVQSAAGPCANPLILQDAYLPGTIPPSTVLASRFVYCDGAQSTYLANVGLSGAFNAALIDLSVPPGGAPVSLSGNSPATYQFSRTAGTLSVAGAAISFTTAGVLNAASFQPGLSPGGIFSLFGSGLSGSGAATTVAVGNLPATVLLATPFQINAQVPAGAALGNSTLKVTSPFGSTSQPVSIQAAAPGIFAIGTASDGVSSLGAVVNQNGTLNGPTAPATRGSTVVIYCTGLGATTVRNGLSVTNATVTAVLSNTNLPVAFAGLTPGFFGLYQINLLIPATTPPGLLLPLTIQEGSAVSNTVVLAVQ